MNEVLFVSAHPYQEDVLALPVKDIDEAAQWYSKAFGMSEVRRHDKPYPTVILARDGVEVGFAISGGDASQDGAAIQVSDIHRAKSELESGGVSVANMRVHEREGKKYQVFFVIAPDELCYYFHQLITD